jgi:arylsulfatase A-like enzyme
MVSTTDHYIGQVVDRLETLGLRENTIVIFMSDNGHSEETKYTIRVDDHKSGYPKGHFYGASGGGNTGKWIGNKSTFLEGGIRVPAIISCPAKLPQGEVRDQIVTAMDWYPTVLQLCGIEQPENAPSLDGHSLLPVIRSADTESNYQGVLHFGWGNTWAVRDGDWKLIGVQPKNGSRAKVSLHNLADANPEVKDYAKEQPAIVARLTELHDQWDSDVSPR